MFKAPALLCLAGVLIFSAPVFPLSIDNMSSLLEEAEASRTRNPEKTLTILSEIEPSLNELPAEQRDRFTFIKAYMFGFKGEQDKAIELAKRITQSNSPVIKVKAYLLLATVYEHKKAYKEAYSALYSAIKSARSISDRALLVNVYTVATQLHVSVSAYDKAVEFTDYIAKYADSERGLCISFTQKLHALALLNKTYPEELATQALDVCEQANEPLMKHSVSIFTADVDVFVAPEKVMFAMQNALPELERIGYRYTILQAKYYLGYALLNLNEPDDAVSTLEQVYSGSIALNDYLTANKAVLLLAQLHEKQGDIVAAAQAYKQHISALNAYIDEYKQRSVAYYLAQADFMESENKLALLQSQNELLQLESKLQRDEKVRTGLISVALLTLLLLVIYVLNSKRVALNRLATTDFLTRLFNRRYFNQTVSRQLQNRRQQDQHSLVVFDIDLFKQINDQYGHATGDKVLQAIAQRCQQHIRKQDILARMGGEEFALFLPGCDLAHAEHIAELCRSSIAATPVQLDKLQVKVSASFGVASSSSADFDKLLQQADTALYRAKAAGRNCVEVAHSSGQAGDV